MALEFYNSLTEIYSSFNQIEKVEIEDRLTSLFSTTIHMSVLRHLVNHLKLEMKVLKKEEIGERLYSIIEYLRETHPDIPVKHCYLDLRNSEMGDISFVCKDKKFYAYRFFLSYQSEVFRTFLDNSNTEFIIDADPDDFKNFLHCLRTTKDNYVYDVGVYNLAKQFDVKFIRDKIIKGFGNYDLVKLYEDPRLNRKDPLAKVVASRIIKCASQRFGIIDELSKDSMEGLLLKGLRSGSWDFYTLFRALRHFKIELSLEILNASQHCSPPFEFSRLYPMVVACEENNHRPYLIEYLSELLNLSLSNMLQLSDIIALIEKALVKFPKNCFLIELMGYFWHHELANKEKALEYYSQSDTKFSRFQRFALENISDSTSIAELKTIVKSGKVPKRTLPHLYAKILLHYRATNKMEKYGKYDKLFELINKYTPMPYLQHVCRIVCWWYKKPDKIYKKLKPYGLSGLKIDRYIYKKLMNFSKTPFDDEAVQILFNAHNHYPESESIKRTLVKAYIDTNNILSAVHLNAKLAYHWIPSNVTASDKKSILKLCLSLHPEETRFIEELAFRFFNEKKYAKAYPLLLKLQDPSNFLLGVTTYKLGLFGESCGHLNRLVREQGVWSHQIKRGMITLAKANLALKDYPAFIDSLLRISDIESKKSIELRDRGFQLCQSMPELQNKTLRCYVHKNSHLYPEYLWIQFQCSYENEEFWKAIRFLDQIIEHANTSLLLKNRAVFQRMFLSIRGYR